MVLWYQTVTFVVLTTSPLSQLLAWQSALWLTEQSIASNCNPHDHHLLMVEVGSLVEWACEQSTPYVDAYIDIKYVHWKRGG